MATRTPQKSQNRPSNNYGGNSSYSSVDLGNATVVRMAREDTRWFVVGIVALALVFLLALPLSLLILSDDLKLRAEIRAEIKQNKKLRAELERMQQQLKEQEQRSKGSEN